VKPNVCLVGYLVVEPSNFLCVCVCERERGRERGVGEEMDHIWLPPWCSIFDSVVIGMGHLTLLCVHISFDRLMN
jgi:hypothetical protein